MSASKIYRGVCPITPKTVRGEMSAICGCDILLSVKSNKSLYIIFF